MSAQQSAQPTIINSIASNVLLFLGLLIAANLTYFLGDHIYEASPWAKRLALASLACSLVGGVFSLLSNLNAHNLARAEERSFATEEDRTDRIKKDRWRALTFLALAIYSGIASALCALLLAFAVVGNKSVEASSSTTGVSVKGKGGAELLRLNGQVDNFRLSPIVGGCSVTAIVGQLTVNATIAQDCTDAE